MTALDPAICSRGSPPARVQPTNPPAPPAAVLAASMRRHPSRCRADRCLRCGFLAPPCPELPGELAAIPLHWRQRPPRSARARYRAVTMLSTELDLAAAQISRICDLPEPIDRDRGDEIGPSERRGAIEHRLAMLEVSARRLAGIVAELRPNDWSLVGPIGGRQLSVAQLAMLPLHRSHARLERELTCR